MTKRAVELNDKARGTIKEVVENAWRGEALAELQNYVRIPCKSKDFDVDWEEAEPMPILASCLKRPDKGPEFPTA